MADKTSDAIKLNLRLPKSLHKRLKQQARRNNVSLNTEIVNQLEGSEAATAKRMTEAMKPLVEDAIETAVAQVTRRLPSKEEIMLDMVLMDLPAPHTEAALQERLRDWPPDKATELLQIFREIQAGTRLPAREQVRRADREREQK
jgi:hypothetical protein